jgi:transposase InsO family protein
MVAEEWEIGRSTVYAARERARSAEPPGKRGPRTQYSDAELTELIRAELAGSAFVGEGHRKVWARLRVAQVRTSKPRVLRLMREAGLLAPSRQVRVLGPRNHEGTILTERPDEMWGTDATSTWTAKEGHVTVFVAVDHCTAEAVGIHAAKVGDRFEALEPIRQAVRDRLGAYSGDVASGLKLRHDHGSQYMSDDFQAELGFLGIESSPAFVRAPEGNGCAERFIRTLKEQLLWVRSFDTVEQLRLALHAWLEIYNERWLIERHGHRPPAQVRRDLLASSVAA